MLSELTFRKVRVLLLLYHCKCLFDPCCAHPFPQYTTLWEAVESEDALAVQSLLSRDRVCGGGEKAEQRGKWEKERERGVNSMSEQGLVPLDVAMLTHNSPLLQILIKAGARHNPYCEYQMFALLIVIFYRVTEMIIATDSNYRSGRLCKACHL